MTHGKKWVAVNELGQRIGETHPNAKLTDHDIDLMFELKASGMSARAIAIKFEISKSHAADILGYRKRNQLAAHWRRPLGR